MRKPASCICENQGGSKTITVDSMEGDLSKKSIHINESFVHAIYIGIVVNSYSDIVAYI